MEHYPEEIQKAVPLLQQMQSNSRDMAMWKNLRLAREVVGLLDSLPVRSASHTPYDKIFLLDILTENISKRDIPRFTISVLERMLDLFGQMQGGDAAEYDDPVRQEWVEEELEKWRKYTDKENVSTEEWIKEYRVHLKFDPIERTREWEEMYEAIEAETDREIGADMPRGMGFCHLYWYTKSAVLTRHGIEWRSPATMNPGVMFD